MTLKDIANTTEFSSKFIGASSIDQVNEVLKIWDRHGEKPIFQPVPLSRAEYYHLTIEMVRAGLITRWRGWANLYVAGWRGRELRAVLTCEVRS